MPDGLVEIEVIADAGGGLAETGPASTLNSTAFTTTHPELVPTQVQVPSSIASGQTLTVDWNTTNSGTGPALPGWTETVALVQGNSITTIGTVTQSTPLAAGASVAREIKYALPVASTGTYQVTISVDSGNAVPEASPTRTDNTATVPLTVTLAPYADLAVSNVTAPAVTIADPATATVGWTVTNAGTGRGVTSTWTDKVIVSASGALGATDNIVLGSFTHNGFLDTGASYTQSQSIALPPGFNGRYTLFVVTNATGTVFENGSTANNSAQLATPFDVVPYAYAKHIVTSVTAAPGASSGQILNLTWVVQNEGIGTTDVSEWLDTVYLSQSPSLANAVQLGQFDHLGFLTVGQSYIRTAQVQLPNGISGPYYFSVATAASNRPNFNSAIPSVVAQGTTGAPYEFIYANTNIGVSDAVNIALTPAPDLVVTNVTIPSTAEEGTAVNVTWTVTNQGVGEADGNWTDNIVLSPTGTTNSGQTVGTFAFTGPLIAGQSYTRTGQIVLPLHMTGVFNVSIVPNA